MNRSLKPTPAYGIPLSGPELELVGSFILVWNQAESLMEQTVMQILNLGPLAIAKVMGSPNTRPKAEIMIEVAKEKIKDPELERIACDCANKVLGMADFRNEVAHGRWSTDIRTGDVRSTKKLASFANMVSVHKIEQKYADLCAVTNALADLNWRLLHHARPNDFSLPSPWHGRF